MAKTNETKPLADITKEAVEHLEAIEGELDEAQKDLDALREIGIDASRLEERVRWGKKAIKVIRDRFGEAKE